MTASTHPISPLRQRMIDDMRLRKLADKTQTHAAHTDCRLRGCPSRKGTFVLVIEIAPFPVRGPVISQAFSPSRRVNGRRCHSWMHARRPIGPRCGASIRHSGIARSGCVAPQSTVSSLEACPPPARPEASCPQRVARGGRHRTTLNRSGHYG